MRKSKEPTGADAKFEIGKLDKMENGEFITGEHRSSQYDAIYVALKKMKQGDYFPMTVPKGVKVRTFHNRTNAAIRRGPVKPPEGCTFRKRTLLDGRIAVCCVSLKDDAEETAKEAAKPAPKPKAAKTAKPGKKAVKAKQKRGGVAAVKTAAEPAPHPEAV